MFRTSRLTRGTPTPKFQDDTFEMDSRSSSTDGAASSNYSIVEDTLDLSESMPRITFAPITHSTPASDAPPIDAPQNKRKFTGTTSSPSTPSKPSFSLSSLFMRPRKQRQSSTSSLSSVDSTGYQL